MADVKTATELLDGLNRRGIVTGQVGWILDLRAYLEAHAARESAPALPTCRLEAELRDAERHRANLQELVGRLTDPQAEEDRSVGEAWRSLDELPGEWSVRLARNCLSENRCYWATDLTALDQENAPTLPELAAKVRARLAMQPERVAEGDGVPKVGACLCEAFRVTPHEHTCNILRNGLYQNCVDCQWDKDGAHYTLIGCNCEGATLWSDRWEDEDHPSFCPWCGTDLAGIASAVLPMQALFPSEQPAPAAPEVPADVREALRKAGATWEVVPDRIISVFVVSANDREEKRLAFTPYGHRQAVLFAQAHDSRPRFHAWCADHGGEAQAVLEFCLAQEPMWGFELDPFGSANTQWNITDATCTETSWSSRPALALLATCRAAGWPTPWQEGTESEEAEDEWQVPGTVEGCIAYLSKRCSAIHIYPESTRFAVLSVIAVAPIRGSYPKSFGQGIDSTLLSSAQDACRWVRAREKEAAGGNAS